MARSHAKQQQESAAKLQAVGEAGYTIRGCAALSALQDRPAGLVEAFHRMDFNNDGSLTTEVIKVPKRRGDPFIARAAKVIRRGRLPRRI